MAFRFLSFVILPPLLAALAVLLAVGWPAAAAAEAFDPPVSVDTVEIGRAGLRPEHLTLTGGQRLVFLNRSGGMARVELELARGEGIACGGSGGAPSRGRKFVVATGERLECEAPTSEVAYRVFRNGGGGLEQLHGSIEP